MFHSTTLLASLVFFVVSIISAENVALDTDMLNRIETQFDQRSHYQSLVNAITNNSIRNLSLNREKLITHDNHFNHTLSKSGITNQKGSGRCWLFAGLNVFNPNVMIKLDLSQFELSEPYLTFWDKMEKANLFLEEMIDLKDRPIDDRKLEMILDSPFGDGGWWHYVTDLVDKYGVVPISAMPETKQSTSTGQINSLTNRKLRAFASELRTLYSYGTNENGLRQRKEEMLGDIYALMVYAYGKPPESFTFRYETKDSSITEPTEYTPQSFYEIYLAGHLPRFATLVNDPSKDFDKLYQIESSRNMADKDDLTILNLPSSSLKEYALRALLDSQTVWFACDVGKMNYSDSGILAVNIYDYETTFGLDFSISKADRMNYRDSSPNHAMVFLGVDTASDGTPLKWLVENSWGKKKGKDGYWTMYDDWFEQYVYMVIVDETLLDQDDRQKLTEEPVPLPVWDPFWKAMR